MRRRPRHTLLVLLAGLTAGCAALGIDHGRMDPERDLQRALHAWRIGDYDAARGGLLEVYGGFADRPVGQRALLALAATEIDPRNPDRRLDFASAFAARYLREPDAPEWAQPLAEALYLLAVDLGGQAAGAVPVLPGPPLATRLRELEARGDSLEARVSALEHRLAERERELERIRKTLKN